MTKLIRLVSKLAVLISAVLALSVQAYAQCSLCKAAVAASQDAAQASGQMNLAVLVLLIPPVAIFVGIFGVGYKYRNYHGAANNRERPPDEL